MIQRLVAEKLGVSDGAPIPKSLSFLSSPQMVEKSWNNYLATTEAFHKKLRHWEMEKLSIQTGNFGRQGLNILSIKNNTNGVWTKTALPAKPAPSEVADGLLEDLIQIDLLDTHDDLKVMLALPAPPVYSNGQWDEERKMVTWEADLLERKPKASKLPAPAAATPLPLAGGGTAGASPSASSSP